MKEVFSDPDYTRVGYAESLLKDAGIECFIRNASTHNLLTGIPVEVFYPRLCVMEESQAEAALELLAPLRSRAEAGGAEWTCAGCGEKVPAAFDLCWNCQAPRPDSQAG